MDASDHVGLDQDIARVAAGMAKSLSAERRNAGLQSLEAFARIYLPHYFRLPPSPMHRDLFRQLESACEQRNARIAFAAPRGHAKSTILSLASVLYGVCRGAERYIIIVSDTAAQAQGHLASIKSELESNELLRRDFPEVCEVPGVRPHPRRWRLGEIETRGPIEGGVRITALGAGEKIRGRRNREHRPTLIILDDIENEATARSEDQRDKLWNWFTKAAAHAGGPGTNIVVAGTIIHYDSLLSRLLDPAKTPGWRRSVYRALISWPTNTALWEAWESIYNGTCDPDTESGPGPASEFYETNRDAMDEGAVALWPEREPLLDLMELRVREGRAAFDSEKQNEPINPEDCYFREKDFAFWDDAYSSEEALLASMAVDGVEFIGACDPSMGREGKHRDDSAIVILARNKRTGVLYVLDADISRRKPDSIIEQIIEHCRARPIVRFAIETNQFQAFLADEVEVRSKRAGVAVNVYRITHTSDKAGRIERLQPKVTSAQIRFRRRHTRLLEQMLRFPLADRDDGPDALEMAVATTGVGQVVVATGRSPRERSLDDDSWGWTTIYDSDRHGVGSRPAWSRSRRFGW